MIFNISLKEDAVDHDGIYNNFYLTQRLRESIKKLVPGISLVNPRFAKQAKADEIKRQEELLHTIENVLNDFFKESELEIHEQDVPLLMEKVKELIKVNRNLDIDLLLADEEVQNEMTNMVKKARTRSKTPKN